MRPVPAKNERLRNARLARGWTTGDLGDRAGVSAGMVGHLEAGRRQGSRKTRQAIAAALGVGVEDVFGPRVDRRMVPAEPEDMTQGLSPPIPRSRYEAIGRQAREEILASFTPEELAALDRAVEKLRERGDLP
jgi:transcriptional regulator with XRE-family HTH domain